MDFGCLLIFLRAGYTMADKGLASIKDSKSFFAFLSCSELAP
jgi:hypothetical protein